MDQRFSDNDTSRRDIPSFIEPLPPSIQNPFMRPRPQKCTNLLERFDEDSEIEAELVQVYLRMKPCEANDLYRVTSDKTLVTSIDTTTTGNGRRLSRMYTFSHIFTAESTQKEIFEKVVKDNLKKLPDGQSFTLLTYGASGSGKTYTLMGTVSSPGLIPRSLEYVFKLVDAAQTPTYKPSDNGADQLGHAQQEFELQWVNRLRHVSAPLRDKYRRMSVNLQSDLTGSTFDLTKRTKYYVWVSFVEIYNEAIYDLLAPPDRRTKLRIREDVSGNVYVKDVTQAFVRSGEEAYDILVAGKHNLVVAATGVHANSSRSHCIFTITMLTENEGEIRTSHIRLCDLAGCERQRAARNNGLRMQESRAINSSLHVLERCMHMLRKKQRHMKDSLVPYRESKLTRLLGSGLSGSRGEAVSMVVTLNPSPQYSSETKHVLTLAGVAQSLQTNTTLYASTSTLSLESSTQDTTISCSAEVMKLRADNERLHFELVQAQARNRELLASMEEKQLQNAKIIREMVEEAKDMTRQYYECEIQRLTAKMEDMKEDYECQLENLVPTSEVGTPSRHLQAKVKQLEKQIEYLEDELAKQELARSRDQEELEHLRGCIEERDEAGKETSTDKHEEVVLTDSEPESDDNTDPLNESLEPMFKKECQNRSHVNHIQPKLLETSKGSEESIDLTVDENETNNITDRLEETSNDKCNESVENTKHSITLDKSVAADKEVKTTHDSVANIYDASDVADDEIERTRDSEANVTETIDTSNKELTDVVDLTDDSVMNNSNIENDKSENEEIFYETTDLRGTYFVANEELSTSKAIEDSKLSIKDDEIKSKLMRGTYFVNNPANNINDKANVEEDNANGKEKESVPIKVAESFIGKIIQSLKISQSSDSLTHFEQLEKAVTDADNSKDKTTDFLDVKVLKEKRHYFDDAAGETAGNKPNSDVGNNGKDKSHAGAVAKNQETTKYCRNKADGDKSSHLSVAAKMQEKLLYCDDNEKNTDSIAKVQENPLEYEEKTDVNKGHPTSTTKTLDKQIYFDDTDKICTNDVIISSSISEKAKVHEISHSTNSNNQDKNMYFDNNEKFCSNDVIISRSGTEKRAYFNNISGNLHSVGNKKVNDIITNSCKYEERSPSIVKDDVGKDFVPSIAMKKLLGDSYTKPEPLSSIQKNKAFIKKQESVDIFESPQTHVAKAIEDNVIPNLNTEKTNDNVDGCCEVPCATKAKELSNIDVIRKSIERLVLEQKLKAANQEIKLEHPIDEPLTDNVLKPKTDKKTDISNDEMDKLAKIKSESDESSEKQIDKVPRSKTESKYDQPKHIIKLSNNKLESENNDQLIIKNEPKSKTDSTHDKTKDIVETKSTITTENSHDVRENNTIDDFETICKDLSNVRATEFELLVSQEINTSNNEKELEKSNKKSPDVKIEDDKEMSEKKRQFEETKYNLRNKGKSIFNISDDKKVEGEEILAESHSKCESKSKTLTKRSLRLRRRKNLDEENSDQDDKLKDIVNLKKEFSDVTMGLPATTKEVKDIPSPEKLPGAEENVPPLYGIQSCPSKSVTRSRRKLFTPRAEPLEESLTQTGDSSERLYVPRPSYHRARARRKL